MEKFLKIGEQYIQWIALGLGGLFLILMGYLYLAQPPITVELDRKPYQPGEIDGQINRGALQIKKDIDSKKPWVTPQPSDAIADLKPAFDRAPREVETAIAPVFKSPTENNLPPELPPTIVKAPAAEPAKVDATGALVDPSNGVSELNIPQPPQAANGAIAAAPAAAVVQPVVYVPQDHDWFTFPWTVSFKSLQAAFQAAHIPANQNGQLVFQTTVLRVELVRQELLPGNRWASERVVQDIPTVEYKPLPPETATIADKGTFLAWAGGQGPGILTPPFFQVLFGTPWYAPGTPKPVDAFAPAGAPMPAVANPVAPVPAVAPRRPLPGAPGGGPFMPRRGYGELPPSRSPQTFPPAAAPPAPGAGVPAPMPTAASGNGFIDPAALTQDITIYTHDWTVEPGHTYRYKVRYWISNPLFNIQQTSIKPADRVLLSIASPDSVWTKPIQIPSRYMFWAQKIQRNGNEVTFDLFAKKPSAPGGVERSTIRVTPGDTIGASPWLLVDVRTDTTKHVYFLVADPTGRIERRDYEKDKSDPDHQQMLDRTGATAIGAAGN